MGIAEKVLRPVSSRGRVMSFSQIVIVHRFRRSARTPVSVASTGSLGIVIVARTTHCAGSMRFGGTPKLVLLICIISVAVFLAFLLLGIDTDFNLGNMLVRSVPTEASPPQPKCGMSISCPGGYFAFRITSGAANIVGPKICLENSILMSGVKNNVGRGINVALVNGRNGKLIKTESFDMWQGDVNNLLTFLKDVDNGTLVMMATFDDSSHKLNDDARKLIAELGSSQIDRLAFRDNWVFVGGKGIQTKSPFELLFKSDKGTNKFEGWPEVLEMDGCIPRKMDQ
ncbi:hypothetical protein AAFF_G00162100 [Aldrovandia affinis]|uniref:ILEI/PANDER domain-containing protein n=1 Tax=Aldrovandia affinis TaxID=143900 RepID=A0AAD7RN30_9TELE|nr:hypothetical protein AAFF_G00162100 [Aldrovandia affinis]